jgi:hypothetical protein
VPRGTAVRVQGHSRGYSNHRLPLAPSGIALISLQVALPSSLPEMIPRIGRLNGILRQHLGSTPSSPPSVTPWQPRLAHGSSHTPRAAPPPCRSTPAPGAARLALGLDRLLRMGEGRASGVPWGDSLRTGDWAGWRGHSRPHGLLSWVRSEAARLLRSLYYPCATFSRAGKVVLSAYPARGLPCNASSNG